MFRYARKRFKLDNVLDVRLKLIRKRDTDRRRYNLPTVFDVTALVVGNVDDSIIDRDIIIESTARQLKRIDVLHPQYLALQYSLLFPYAEDSYRNDIETSFRYNIDGSKKRTRISMREFFSYRVQMRGQDCPMLLQSRRLFQQFLVDAYTMIEVERLNFLRFNQCKLRVENYRVLHESFTRGEADAVVTGQRIILPSSFTGGPRYMFNNCKDAFAICKYAGYPSYFITITCNPEWTEIKRLLQRTGLQAQDRPDIVFRVFKIKLNNLMRDLKDGKYFGKISGYVCTIEFQKRGLPHAHILLFMHPSAKPKSPSDIDRHISAEIPDQRSRPKLYAAVEKFMVHGPCGKYNKDSLCMINGRCSKFFPKPFRVRTITDEVGFPKYKRVDNGRTISKRNVLLDNSYIVPYNPSLLLKYSCHINVEHTCQTSAIKYLFKYVRKGNDRVTASFFQTSDDGSGMQVVDEIRNYYDCRYISASEAAWRIFGYDIQVKEPTVIRLPFHLPNEHPIVFRDNESIEDVIERADGKLTKLLAWMAANKRYEIGRTLTYSEFPNKFEWKEDHSMWVPRKIGFSIGRLSHVPRGNGEDYYLRLLLNIQRGCTSFRDIRTMEGVSYSSFKDTCYALGLLQDDREFIDAILEASTWASAKYLRGLFVVLLISNTLSRPEYVWEIYYKHFADDILFEMRRTHHNQELCLTDEQILNLTLKKVEEHMQANGRPLRDFKTMPYLCEDDIDGLDDRMIIDELNFDHGILHSQCNESIHKMTDEQRHAFDEIVKVVHLNLCGFFFLYGYGGTGKTFLYTALSAAIRSKGDIVINVASSGIAALLLPNGRTAHSRFRIPLNIYEYSVYNIKQGSSLARLICKAKLIIWDEAPMLSKYCYEALDKSLKDILRFETNYNQDKPFGGKVVVLGGDFRQILPVIPMGSRQDIIQASINSSYLWNRCKVLKLTKNMRLNSGVNLQHQVEVDEFAKWILLIGDGLTGVSTDGESEVLISDELIIPDEDNSFERLVRFVYPDLLSGCKEPDYFKEHTILAPTLEVVNEVNNSMMESLSGEERIYLSSDSLSVEEGNMEAELDTFSTDILNAINCSGIPPHKLKLKPGVPVMLLRNIDQSNGLCNGTRLQVRRMASMLLSAWF